MAKEFEASETSTRRIAAVNPANGRVLKEYELESAASIEVKLQHAWRAFADGSSMTDRAQCMHRAADALLEQKQRFATLMTAEMGKPLKSALEEVEKCASACAFYADNAASFLTDEPCRAEGTKMFVRYQPLGPVLAVMPWNFPFWQVFRFAAPALMAGNVGLLKHASNVPGCALAIEELFRRAGFPEGAFQTLLIGSGEVARIIADDRVRAVTLTGSVEAGRNVAAEAGRCIKKTVLELGGSDPFIIAPSANIELAAQKAVQARTINSGQSCIAAKRFIVHQEVAEAFQTSFVKGMEALRMGDPMDLSTDIGPLATREVLHGLQEQVNATVRQGAKVLLGGKPVEGEGFYFPPTVLTDVPAESPAACDELFGPVAAIFVAKDFDHALRIANATPFGLGSCLWSNDPGEQEAFITRIEAGAAFVNGMVASNPQAPFGGIKLSGYGRELGAHGIREFVNVKTVVVRTLS